MADRIRQDVALGPVDDALRAALVEEGWLEDSETNRLLGYGKGLPGIVALQEQVVGAIQGENGSGSLGIYRGGEPVGLIVLVQAPAPRRSVRFTMLMPAKVRGRGIAPTALALLCDRVLVAARAYRLEAELLAGNKAAIKWLRHEGFTQEGFHKHSWWSDDSPHSTVLLRMLAPQWRRLQKDRDDAGSAGALERLQTDSLPGSNPGPAPLLSTADDPAGATTFESQVVESAGEEVVGHS